MRYVQLQDRLSEVAAALAGVGLFAADTEAAGYHRYDDRVCLLQLSTRTETYIVDTLAVEHLDELDPFFSAAEIEVVFHDADYDLRLLGRDFGLVVRGLFDTKVAAQFLGEPAIGLASLLERYLGVTLRKQFQRADWAQRPLPGDMLEYAAEDTRYLPELRDRLRSELEERGRLGWAEEEFRLQETVRWAERDEAVDAEAFTRVKGSRELTPRQLAALRELHDWRDRVAREKDRAPFRVISNEALLEIARRSPESARELMNIRGISKGLLSSRANELLAALRRARELPENALPQRPRSPGRPPSDPDFDAIFERLRNARDHAADDLGLDRGFLLPRHQLEEIARRRPGTGDELARIEGFRRWQIAALGDAVLAAVSA